MRYHYETPDPDPWPEAVRIEGHRGVAWTVHGWHTEPDRDTEWTGIEQRTGQLVCVMVGDDAQWLFEPNDVNPLAREDYCGECGQIGCRHDGLARGTA